MWTEANDLSFYSFKISIAKKKILVSKKNLRDIRFFRGFYRVTIKLDVYKLYWFLIL